MKILPFKNLSIHGWQNIALFSMFLLYFGQISLALYSQNLFNTLGSDFLGFWTTGKIANTEGYGQIYNQELIAQIQKPFHESVQTDILYVPILNAFFPIFGLPFQLLALLHPMPSFLMWFLINIAVFIIYICFFIYKTLKTNIPSKLLLIFLFSYPFFHNIFWGQVEVWLMICIGEFIRLSQKEKHFFAGLWLAGMVLKPQTLILLIPFVILRKDWRGLFGFIGGSGIIVLTSIFLVGIDGIIQLTVIWFSFASGIATNAPEHMANWRMVMTQFKFANFPTLGIVLGITGIFVTLLPIIKLFHRRISKSFSEEFVIYLLGIIAATLAITWHSHIHMMILLIPPLIYLFLKKKIPEYITSYWIFLPPLLMLLSLACLFLGALGVLPITVYEGYFFAWWGLVFNLLILLWSIKAFKHS